MSSRDNLRMYVIEEYVGLTSRTNMADKYAAMINDCFKEFDKAEDTDKQEEILERTRKYSALLKEQVSQAKVHKSNIEKAIQEAMEAMPNISPLFTERGIPSD